MDYIYLGEVQLPKDELNRFLQVAQRLELDGAVKASNFQEAPVVTNDFYLTLEEGECNNEISEVVPKYDEPPALFKSEPENHAQLDKVLSQRFSRTIDNLFQCNHCPKSFTSTSHAKDHAETHIEGLNFLCKYCGKSFKTRHNRRGHESQERKKFIHKQRTNVVMLPNESLVYNFSEYICQL